MVSREVPGKWVGFPEAPFVSGLVKDFLHKRTRCVSGQPSAEKAEEVGAGGGRGDGGVAGRCSLLPAVASLHISLLRAGAYSNVGHR